MGESGLSWLGLSYGRGGWRGDDLSCSCMESLLPFGDNKEEHSKYFVNNLMLGGLNCVGKLEGKCYCDD